MSRDFKEISNILQKSVREKEKCIPPVRTCINVTLVKNTQTKLQRIFTLTRYWASKYIKSTQE